MLFISWVIVLTAWITAPFQIEAKSSVKILYKCINPTH